MADLKDLAPNLRAIGPAINAAREASFRTVIKRATPEFNAQARAAAGGDQILSRARNRGKLTIKAKIHSGPDVNRSFMSIDPRGPWGIRDSTDDFQSRLPRHRIAAKNARFLRFELDGETVYRRSVNHPGGKRQKYWDKARKNALKHVQTQIPKDTSDAIIAALNGRPYKSRSARV